VSVSIVQADARHIPLRDGIVQCVVTSPPYWGLRKYHGEQGDEPYGLEPTIGLYLDTTIAVLREIRRVLRPDGVVFWNIGDSYAGSWGNYGARNGEQRTVRKERYARDAWEGHNGRPPMANPQAGLKPKDLCLIPARVALAAQADGWWVRSLIIWAKPNPMPESCKDRPTDAYEHIIMLTKSERYFWDADAVRERQVDSSRERAKYGWHGRTDDGSNGARTGSTFKVMAESDGPIATIPADGFRNMRNVWHLATQPYKGAHYATFPEEIPRRCILAATSERGACEQCGAPWQRQVKVSGGTGDWTNKSDREEKGKDWSNPEIMAAANGVGGAGEDHAASDERRPRLPVDRKKRNPARAFCGRRGDPGPERYVWPFAGKIAKLPFSP
jgi:DNA modification methylase